MTTKNKSPAPLFDSLQYINWDFTYQPLEIPQAKEDYKWARDYLYCYKDNLQTFNAYRREIERYLSWCWFVANKSIFEIRRDLFEEYIRFCLAPPLAWIGVKKTPRFIDNDKDLRTPNPEWRPFVATVTKAAYRQGTTPDKHHYLLSQKALQEVFAIISSFYNYLIQENIHEINPVSQIRQKSKFLRKQQTKNKIRRLSEKQWHHVFAAAESMAAQNPDKHERTLFIITALYAMYLRISELVASDRWLPAMNSFAKDHNGAWWFTTIGKGNKERQIAVSDSMLEALKRYRTHLNLSPLPTRNDNSPLLRKLSSNNPITCATYIREIVQECFDLAIAKLQDSGFKEDADELMNATVHWLRHTGISEDVKHRPREHVRDDAGHSSSAITDKYIDVELRARHKSAKNKTLMP